MSNRPELLAPAGDWASLRAAVNEGADGVYFGVHGLNMRDLAGNFDILELKKIMQYLKASSRRGYLALNTVILPKDQPLARKILDAAKKAQVDAVIAWDMAVISHAREIGLDVHLSTQASAANFDAVKFYVSLGIKRIVLARECSLADIKDIVKHIRKEKLKCDIEVFVHGAMCVSVSGRCFLSQYTFNKSANKGECLQPCRREYTIKDTDNEAEYILGQDYILSPKDLCCISIVDKLIEAGVGAFKIEGRRRAPEYVKVAVASYRRAIDAYCQGKLDTEFKTALEEQLRGVYNRGFSTGFYLGAPKDWQSRELEGENEKIFAAEVAKFYKKISVAEVIVRCGILAKNDMILITGKHTGAKFTKIDEIEQNHQKIPQAKRSEKVAIKLPFCVKAGDKVFLWRGKIPPKTT